MRTILAARRSEAPPCPSWCTADHSADNLLREHAGSGIQVGSFLREAPLMIGLVQVTYMAPGPVDTAPAVRIGTDVITPQQARQVAAALLNTADLADLTTRGGDQ